MGENIAMSSHRPTKVCWLTVTFRRPRLLGQLIHCFLNQDYPAKRRTLLILDDDAKQYTPNEGDGWKIITVNERYPSLGAKRNAIAEMAPKDTDLFMICDDDDLQLPWATRAHVTAIEKSCCSMSKPSRVWWNPKPDTLKGGPEAVHHSSWAYKPEIFFASGGYPNITVGEDEEWMNNMRKAGVTITNPLSFGFAPYYISRQHCQEYHAHLFDRKTGYQQLGDVPSDETHYEINIKPGFRLDGTVPRLL